MRHTFFIKLRDIRFLLIGVTVVVFILIIVGASFWHTAKAGQFDNISGWIWSDNIGWVSLNSTNCDADGNGISDGIPSGCPPVGVSIPTYGVNLDLGTGSFFGYGWSENIGWIDFAPTNGYPENPKISAKITGNQVTGWIKAVAGGTAESGGWDGWIKMSGSWANGVTLESGIFKGYAWGSDVIGWFDMSGMVFNNPPPTSQCSDNIDNDGDNLTDYPADPGCVDAVDNDETDPLNPNSTQCSDNIDNDGDNLTDYPNDLGCSGSADDSETNPTIILSINADSVLIRIGGQTIFTWDTQFVTSCTITGPGVNIDSGPIVPYDTFSGSRNVTNITEETTLTLSCVDFNGNTSSASARVNMLPSFEEF